jgi:hypothetical protein
MLLVYANASAREFSGIQFPDRVTLPGSDVELQLNGIGMRSKFIFDIYIGALYTTEPVQSREAVQALQGPNRVLMHFVYDEVEREKLVSAWNDGFESNTTDAQYAAIRGRIDQFNALFETVSEGDEILLDYLPGEGTRVIIKGETKGVIPGEDFNHALLDIWLGEEPADSDLKDAMLGVD